jgi:endonuclease/exonuclease/phosphatase (EEP) superfamily protein YafD
MKVKAAIQYGITTLLLLVTFICVFTPSMLFFKNFTQYTLYIMLGLLALGIFSFVVENSKTMMMSLLCCGILCLYLKSSSNDKIRLPLENANPSLTITHISLGNAENDYATVIDYLMSIDADLLSFQELTPDWNAQLIDKLSSKYNYVQTVTRLDQYGMGFFSKLPFEHLDTIYYKEIPNLVASVKLRGHEECTIISCQVTPPVNQSAYSSIVDHFHFISMYMRQLSGSVVVLGDFHLPPWSKEVQKFKEESHLSDGRRDIHTRNLDGSMSLPRIPVEHILFSDAMDCTSFAEIGNSVVGRLGIVGTYQIQHEEILQ